MENNNQIISYLTLRFLIGILGILLPFLLVIGKLIFSGSYILEDSISDYYDDGTAGDIFVGVLFVLGFFLFAYRGYEPIDNRAANFGCVFAIGVALCPTMSEIPVVSALHFVFAALLFGVFIFFSLYLFRKHDPSTELTVEKKSRNRIYLISGIFMIICIVGIAISHFAAEEFRHGSKIVFWLESLALVSFGFSWITKAEIIFGDYVKN